MNLIQILMVSPLYDWLGKRTYAQSGEDIIVWGELKNSKKQKTKKSKSESGFYVDVGAYHPKLFSNTYLFYQKGWKGICIDPNPEMANLFRLARPRDLFLNVGVGEVTGDQRGVSSQDYLTRRLLKGKDGVGDDEGRAGTNRFMEYYMFEDGAANTFSIEQARRNQKEAGRKLVEKRKIPIMSLKTILDKYLPKGQKIDLLSVDVEGMDEEVLRSNDWKKYRPKMIIAEDLNFDFANPMRSKVVKLLDSVGYRLVVKTPYSLIFRVVK